MAAARRRGAGAVGLASGVAAAREVAPREAAKNANQPGPASSVQGAKVWNLISTELPLDASRVTGPAAKADVIVSEVLDAGCIGEGVPSVCETKLTTPSGSGLRTTLTWTFSPGAPFTL